MCRIKIASTGTVFALFLFLCSATARTRQSAATEPRAERESEAYFPNGFSGEMTNFLRNCDEPSLLAAAKDASLLSYRFESIAGQSGRSLAVRLIVNPDGSGKIFLADRFVARDASKGDSHVLRKAEVDVSTEDVNRLLMKIEKAEFWSMPSEEPETSDERKGIYMRDSDTYVFEGVRRGNYHVAVRRGPEGGPFEEMIAFLARDLAHLTGTAIPPHQPSHKDP